MTDHDHYLRVALRLRRWAMNGTWRRLRRAAQQLAHDTALTMGFPTARRLVQRSQSMSGGVSRLTAQHSLPRKAGQF